LNFALVRELQADKVDLRGANFGFSRF